MRTPLFLNESRAVDELGDLRLFESANALCQYVEPIDVEHGEYFAFDADGLLLALRTDGREVRVEAAEAEPAHASVLARLLRESFAVGLPADPTDRRDAASLGELVSRASDLGRASRSGEGVAASLAETARRWLAPG